MLIDLLWKHLAPIFGMDFNIFVIQILIFGGNFQKN